MSDEHEHGKGRCCGGKEGGCEERKQGAGHEHEHGHGCGGKGHGHGHGHGHGGGCCGGHHHAE